MKIYYGICPKCAFIWHIADRMPNYCPECACTLFTSVENLLIASKNFKEYEFQENN